jgi:PTS system mannose-specific IID component/fructoselysine and glucoselysine-specific PTS system IID component
MPQMLPFALTMFMYWLLQKKVNTSVMLLICIVGGLVLSALGVFV